MQMLPLVIICHKSTQIWQTMLLHTPLMIPWLPVALIIMNCFRETQTKCVLRLTFYKKNSIPEWTIPISNLMPTSRHYTNMKNEQGYTCLLPVLKRNIKTFIQWVKDDHTLGRKPFPDIFLTRDVSNLYRRYKTYAKFIAKYIIL